MPIRANDDELIVKLSARDKDAFAALVQCRPADLNARKERYESLR